MAAWHLPPLNRPSGPDPRMNVYLPIAEMSANVFLFLGMGAAVGFLSGLFGVGGGFLIIPALVLLLGLPMSTATGTSLLIIVINSAAGFAAHAGDTTLDYRVAAAFTFAAITGSLPAARLATRIPADRLRQWFAYLVLAVAAFVVVQTLLDPAAVG
jgi:uncharacterized protein